MEKINENSLKEKSLSFYWWIKGKYLSDIPDEFKPSNDDTLEEIAWSSMKYDSLGGPNTKNIILTYLQGNRVKNPNNVWDMSSSMSLIMKRVFHFENLMNFLTIILHIFVLFPVITTYSSSKRPLIGYY